MIRPVSTYSIVARDPGTGELGAAVQSHYFSVGPIVPWVEPGVGAVCTQSMVEISYGPEGLEGMREGQGAPETLARLLAADSASAVRQVAMVDSQGRVAVHTGARCIAAAGHVAGEQFSVQANMMDGPEVWPAMARAFREAPGDLAERMLVALEAAEGAGGDVRGRQSAALVLARPERATRPWEGRTMDLRVEDHPEPLQELRRLVRLRRAYNFEDEGDGHVAAGRMNEAKVAYARAAELASDVDELVFWNGVALLGAGERDEARGILRPLFRRDARWSRLLPRLVPAGILPADPEDFKDLM